MQDVKIGEIVNVGTRGKISIFYKPVTALKNSLLTNNNNNKKQKNNSTAIWNEQQLGTSALLGGKQMQSLRVSGSYPWAQTWPGSQVPACCRAHLAHHRPYKSGQ